MTEDTPINFLLISDLAHTETAVKIETKHLDLALQAPGRTQKQVGADIRE